MYIAKFMMHKWEEEPISGIERNFAGTFAIFFYGCNMHCLFCQNRKISQVNFAKTRKEKYDYSSIEVAEKMLMAEKEGACTISFITGVFYIDEIVETIKIAREKGLKIPIVYNSNGYEKVEHIRKLDSLVDIYLLDFKYFDEKLGKKYSKVSDYPMVAKDCINEMYKQVGPANNIYKKGMIIRHLILPMNTKDSKKVIEYLYNKYGDNVYLSIMSQYTPPRSGELCEPVINRMGELCEPVINRMGELCEPVINRSGELCEPVINRMGELCEPNYIEYDELKRKLTKNEYSKVIDFALKIGVKNAYIQEGDVALDSFIPDFE